MRLIRWLLPLSFALASLPMVSPLGSVDPSLKWWSLACAAACAVFVVVAAQRLTRTLWAWIIFAVFYMGYFLKAMIYSWTYQIEGLDIWTSELSWLTLHNVAVSYRTTAQAFILFCLLAVILLRVRLMPNSTTDLPNRPEVSHRWLWAILLSTLLISAIAAALPPLLGFGLMGGEQHTLPFRADAIITRFRVNVGPAILLWVLWICDQPKYRALWFTAISGMSALALADAITRASRGSLLLVLIPVLMLWIIYGSFTRGRKAFGALVMALVIALYPVFGLQRAFRNQNSAGAVKAVALALKSDRGDQWLKIVLLRIGTRLPGAEGLWHLTRYFRDHRSEEAFPNALGFRLQLAMHTTSMVRYQTQQVVGIDDPTEGRSPGVLAALANVSNGLAGIFVGFPVYIIMIWLAWNLTSRLRIAPVALAVLANFILFYSSEGGLGVQDPIAFIVSATVVTLVQIGVQRTAARRAHAARGLHVLRSPAPGAAPA